MTTEQLQYEQVKALLLLTDPNVKTVDPKNETDFKLEELYEMLECDMIEVVPLKHDYIMIIDEEGKLKEKDFNSPATQVYHTAFPNIHDVIVGHALVCHNNMLQ